MTDTKYAHTRVVFRWQCVCLQLFLNDVWMDIWIGIVMSLVDLLTKKYTCTHCSNNICIESVSTSWNVLFWPLGIWWHYYFEQDTKRWKLFLVQSPLTCPLSKNDLNVTDMMPTLGIIWLPEVLSQELESDESLS